MECLLSFFGELLLASKKFFDFRQKLVEELAEIMCNVPSTLTIAGHFQEKKIVEGKS